MRLKIKCYVEESLDVINNEVMKSLENTSCDSKLEEPRFLEAILHLTRSLRKSVTPQDRGECNPTWQIV